MKKEISSQVVVFLGYHISTVTMTISLPLENSAVGNTFVERVISIMTYAVRHAIAVAPMYHHQLQALINRVIPLAGPSEGVKQSYHY